MAIQGDVSAASAKEVLLGIGALTLFVTVGTIAAGTNDNWGSAVLALFIGFALLQITINASVFQHFLSAHPIITGQVTP